MNANEATLHKHTTDHGYIVNTCTTEMINYHCKTHTTLKVVLVYL